MTRVGFHLRFASIVAALAMLTPSASAADLSGDTTLDQAAGVNQPTKWAERKGDSSINELNGRLVDASIVKLPLAKVLEIIAKQAQVTATIEKGLTATVTDLRLKGPLRMSMDQLADQIGAVWWWRGQELRIASRRNSVTKTIKTRNSAALMAAAKDLGMPVHVVTVQKAGGLGLLRMTGPSALVADIDALSTDIEKQLNTVQIMRYGKPIAR